MQNDDPKNDFAAELLKRAAETQSFDESQSEPSGAWAFICELWNKADRDRKVMYCFIIVGVLFVVVGTPVLIIRQMPAGTATSNAQASQMPSDGSVNTVSDVNRVAFGEEGGAMADMGVNFLFVGVVAAVAVGVLTVALRLWWL